MEVRQSRTLKALVVHSKKDWILWTDINLQYSLYRLEIKIDFSIEIRRLDFCILENYNNIEVKVPNRALRLSSMETLEFCFFRLFNFFL